MFLWRKHVAPHRAEAWLERLGAVVSTERLVVVTPAGGRMQRLEAYVDTSGEAHGLARQFGGKASEIRDHCWLPSPSTVHGKPLSFGRHLLVTGHADELERLRTAHPHRHVLCVPAAMAFGTGEHATTAMCLRFLAETATKRCHAGKWTLLDLGSGSGVLALAGKMYGAAEAIGLDNDRHAVRISRENATLNAPGGVRFQQADLLRPPWPLRRQGGWSVVTANLFSELLISLLPQIVGAMASGGTLIASGILATQSDEVESAFGKNDLKMMTRRRRGRWVAYLAQKATA